MSIAACSAGICAFGIGSKDDRGLSEFGRDVVREMNRLGVIVDLAHINRAGFFEAVELSTDPCLVTHTGVSGVHQRWRNIDDEQIRAVAARGGAVGIIFATQHIGGNTVESVERTELFLARKLFDRLGADRRSH